MIWSSQAQRPFTVGQLKRDAVQRWLRASGVLKTVLAHLNALAQPYRNREGFRRRLLDCSRANLQRLDEGIEALPHEIEIPQQPRQVPVLSSSAIVRSRSKQCSTRSKAANTSDNRTDNEGVTKLAVGRDRTLPTGGR